MNELIARAGALFVAPAPAAAAPRAATGPPADLVGVLAPAADLAAVAGAVAADLRRRHRARTALVCTPGDPGPPRTATIAARSLAARLTERDLPASPIGGLVRVGLGEDPQRDAWRAITAAAGCPAVVAATSRTPALDALLAQADRLLLALPDAGDSTYAELALATLAAVGPPTARIDPPSGVLTRRLAALGLHAPREVHA